MIVRATATVAIFPAVVITRFRVGEVFTEAFKEELHAALIEGVVIREMFFVEG